jgi:hypothetical protein
VLGFGSDSLLRSDGGVSVYDEPTESALRYLLRLVEEGCLTPLERDAMIAWFATGEVGLILSGSYSIPQFTALGLEFQASPLPMCMRTGRPVSGLVDYKGFAIPRKAENSLLARRLVQHLVGVGVQARFARRMYKLSSLPLAARIIEETEADGGRLWRVMRESRARGTVIPGSGSYDAYKDTMWKLLRLVFGGQLGVREALEAGERIVDQATEGGTER